MIMLRRDRPEATSRKRDGHLFLTSHAWEGNHSLLYDIDSAKATRKLLADLPMPDLGFFLQQDGAPRFASGVDDQSNAVVFRLDDASGRWNRLPATGARRYEPFQFSSDGREDLRLVPVKRFDMPFDLMTGMALAGLRHGYSTRLGAALRYAGRSLSAEPCHHRLVLVLSDGEPSDIDVREPGYLDADARRAVQQLRTRGIAVHCLALGGGHDRHHEDIFGSRGFTRIHELKTLPSMLSAVYLKMTG